MRERRIVALRINDMELHALDAHSHLGRRKLRWGTVCAGFLGEDLVRKTFLFGTQGEGAYGKF
jgi:hypothetical protein